MNAGERERARVGWLVLVVSLGVVLCVVAHFAGVPGYWAPLVIGGGLGVLTAFVAGSPGRGGD